MTNIPGTRLNVQAMPKVVDVLNDLEVDLWTWLFKVNDTPDWMKYLRDEFYTKNNQFESIAFDSTSTRK